MTTSTPDAAQPASADSTASGGTPSAETLASRLAGRRKPSHQQVRTPWWRRLTALVSLASLVVIAGITLAAVAGASALLLLMFLERAAG